MIIAYEAVRVHAANEKWWRDLDTGQAIERNFGELVMLTISELAEALEGDRKNLMDDKLPHRPMIEVELADTVIRMFDYIGAYNLRIENTDESYPRLSTNTGENLLHITQRLCNAYQFFTANCRNLAGEELAGALSIIFELAYAKNLDLLGAYEEKMAYNAVREDHKIEARKLANGKKY